MGKRKKDPKNIGARESVKQNARFASITQLGERAAKKEAASQRITIKKRREEWQD